MNIEELLKGRRCQCGNNHRCDIDTVIIKSGAVDEVRCLRKIIKALLWLPIIIRILFAVTG